MANVAFAQPPFNAGDWISYRDTRWARALDAGPQDLFVATSGGILRYREMRQTWDEPTVVGYSISAAVPVTDPVLIFYDERGNNLWVATRTAWLQYDVGAERWRKVQDQVWDENDRVVNIGANANDLFVEVIPAELYGALFPPGSPLPDPSWQAYVRRYKAARTYGFLTPDLSGTLPPDIRWRGLRSKVPLRNQDLFGATGLAPAGFPVVFLPNGWIWQSDGVLTDPYIRANPVTDWLVDRFGNLWVTFWGAGLLKADLRAGRAQLLQFGPAGNNIRALWIGKDDLWMGGYNTGERQGVSVASYDLKTWQFHERRDDAVLRSTDVADIAEWDGSVWLATDQGLLEYHEKGGRWKHYDVGNNLQDDDVRALAVSDTCLWIGTVRGLCLMTRGREVWRAASPGIELAGVTDLALCGDMVYVATPQGLFKGSGKTKDFVYVDLQPPLLNAAVHELAIENSTIWLCTSDGVEAYNQADGTAKSWLASTWMNGAEPSSICATDSYVWIGTTESGFYRFLRGKPEWISYTTADGLLDNRVQVIRRDGDDLFIGTATGLTRFFWNRPGTTK